MRSARLAAVLVAASLLTGCVSTAGLPEPVETPTESPAAPAEFDADLELCAEWIDGFDFPIHDSLGVIADIDVSPESMAAVNGLDRGRGACAPASSQPQYLSAACEPVLIAPDSLDGMGVADALEYMFHAGALRQISGTLTGRTDGGERFTYSMAAWRFRTAREASVAPLARALAACPDAASDDGGSVTVQDGAEPHARVTIDGTDVRVLRSARVIADGVPLGLRSTESGLLSAASFDAIDSWWRAEAESLLDAAPSEP